MSCARPSCSPPAATTFFRVDRLVKPLSNMALLMMLRRLDVPVTAHGFRSSFRDWAAEVHQYTK